MMWSAMQTWFGPMLPYKYVQLLVTPEVSNISLQFSLQENRKTKMISEMRKDMREIRILTIK